MAQDKKKQEAIKRLEKLLYYVSYMSENILLRDQIIEIYNLLSDQDYAKDYRRIVYHTQRQARKCVHRKRIERIV